MMSHCLQLIIFDVLILMNRSAVQMETLSPTASLTRTLARWTLSTATMVTAAPTRTKASASLASVRETGLVVQQTALRSTPMEAIFAPVIIPHW